MLEDFEDNISIFDAGDTSFFQILTNGGFSSNNYLQSLNSSGQHRSVTAPTFTWDNTTTETLRTYLRLDLGGTNLAALRFGAVNNTFNGYGIYIDSRNGTGGTAGFQLRINNTTTPLAFQEVLITPSVWYRVEVGWQNTSPRITARLYEGNNTTLLAELTSNDTSYTSGSVGVHAFDLASFDTVGFIPPEPPPPPNPPPSSTFDIILRNPGGGFNIVLSDVAQPELVYVGSNWTSRYLGIRSDAQIYVGNQILR